MPSLCPMQAFHTCLPLNPVINVSPIQVSEFVKTTDANSLAEARESWEKDGYAILHETIDFAVIDSVASHIKQHLPDRTTSGKGTSFDEGSTRITDAWIDVPQIRNLAEHPAVLKFIRQLTGRDAMPFQTLSFKYGTQQPAHSDIMHFGTVPQGLMVAAWVALEDIHPDSGPVLYYPGSNKLPVAYLEDLAVPDGGGNPESYFGYETALEQQILPGLEVRPALLKKGETFLWSANLFHGGSTINDTRLTRLSQVTHYYLEGAERYWVPRASNIRRGRIAERGGPWHCVDNCSSICDDPYYAQLYWHAYSLYCGKEKAKRNDRDEN